MHGGSVGIIPGFWPLQKYFYLGPDQASSQAGTYTTPFKSVQPESTQNAMFPPAFRGMTPRAKPVWVFV